MREAIPRIELLDGELAEGCHRMHHPSQVDTRPALGLSAAPRRRLVAAATTTEMAPAASEEEGRPFAEIRAVRRTRKRRGRGRGG